MSKVNSKQNLDQVWKTAQIQTDSEIFMHKHMFKWMQEGSGRLHSLLSNTPTCLRLHILCKSFLNILDLTHFMCV